MTSRETLPEPLRELADPAYERLWREARRKFKSAGGVGKQVSVRLERLSAEECGKLPVLLPDCYGRLKPGGVMKVALRELEQELGKRPYYVPNLREWFRLLYGEPLLTRKELEEQTDRKWSDLFAFMEDWPSAEKETEPGEGDEPAGGGEATEVDEVKERAEATEVGTSASCPASVRQWLIRLRDGRAAGYRTLKEMLRTESDQAGQALKQCADALAALAANRRNCAGGDDPAGIRLPVLADAHTGDPHGFDWKEKRGRLLYYGLLEVWGGGSEAPAALQSFDREPGGEAIVPEPLAVERELEQLAAAADEQADAADDRTSGRVAEESGWQGRHTLDIRAVYRRAGIRDDDVSSQVLLWGEPFTNELAVSLTLQQVEARTNWPLSSDVYIVENPSVFSSLIDAAISSGKGEEDRLHWLHAARLLVCPSGQPSAAAVQLLDQLHQRLPRERKFYYSGDFDVNGLAIAHRLAERYEGRFVPWCMDRSTYDRHVRPLVRLSEKESSQLQLMQPAWEPPLAQHMADKGYKCYQESLISELQQDWIQP